MSKINPGRALSMARPLRTHVCEECENEFEARDPRALYCSVACKSAAAYARKTKRKPA